VEIITRHSHLGSLNDPSNYSSTTQTDHASTVSRSSGAAAAPAHHVNQAGVSYERHELPSPPTEVPSPDFSGPDSPPLGRDVVGVVEPVSPQQTGGPAGVDSRWAAGCRR
jgi:hypothetical protein